MKIGVGSVVILKSGGPLMTVSEVFPRKDGEEESVSCTWYGPDGKFQSGMFFTACLKAQEFR